MLNDTIPTHASGDDPPATSPVFLPAEYSGEADASTFGRPATIEEIKAACAECESYGGGEGYFGRQWDDRVLGLLLPSYNLLWLTGGDPDRLAIAIRQSGVPTTKATRKNPPLICVKITARPKDKAQMKLCSGWADILNEARAENISVDQFVEWVKARKKQSQAANKRDEPNGGSDPTQLKLRLTRADGPVDEVLSLPPAAHAALRDALKAPGPLSERVQRLAYSLLTFAEELKMGRTGLQRRRPQPIRSTRTR